MRIYPLLILLVLAGCAQVSNISPYNITGSIPYNAENCSSITYGDGYHTGLMLRAIDNDTGAVLQASAQWRTTRGLDGFGTDAYTCIEGLEDNQTYVTVMAAGHAPRSFIFPPEQGNLSTVQVTLFRSGTVASDCTESIAIANPQATQEMLDAGDEAVASAMDAAGIDMPYNLSYSECNIGRGGYVKARGTKDGKPFSVYYRHGWCSSGGSDCGSSICLSTADDDLFESQKNNLCSQLIATVRYDGRICMSPESNTTLETRTSCESGAYSGINGSNVIAFDQYIGRCDAYVKARALDCFGS